MPFGGGARNCIGLALAQMELTLIISRLAQRLDVAPTSDVAPPPIGMVVNRPTGALLMGWVIQVSSACMPFAPDGFSALACAAAMTVRRTSQRGHSVETAPPFRVST